MHNSGVKVVNQRSNMATNPFVSKEISFEKLGIGGMDKQFEEMFRRAFASRVFPPHVVKRLGIIHVKGMLLHGPPGTGKTLIARQIGKMLNGREPKIVNGPELLNKCGTHSPGNVHKEWGAGGRVCACLRAGSRTPDSASRSPFR